MEPLNAIQLPQLKEYPHEWAAKQFGQSHASQIGEMLTRYTQFNSRRKPELLSPDTYSLTNYHEAEQAVAEYNMLAAEAARIGVQLPARYHDAYFQLVQFPIEASANLNEAVRYCGALTSCMRHRDEAIPIILQTV